MELLYSRDDVTPDRTTTDSTSEPRQSIAYRRNCGVIEGDLSELLPFIYIFQHGNCGRKFMLPVSDEVNGIFGVNEKIHGGTSCLP